MSPIGVAPPTPDTWEAFQDKVRPNDDVPLAPADSGKPDWVPSMDAWATAVRRLKPNKGCRSRVDSRGVAVYLG